MLRSFVCVVSIIFGTAYPAFAADKMAGLKMELNNPRNKPNVVSGPDHPVIEGAKSWQFYLKDGACKGNKYYDDCKGKRERSEYTEKRRTQAKPGVETWYRFSFYIPKSTPALTPALTNLFQFQDTSGSAEITLGLFFEPNGAFLFQSDPNNPQVDDMNPPKPMAEKRLLSLGQLRGRWQSFDVQAVWSPNSDGLINVWLNGKKVYAHAGRNLVRNVGPTFKFGIYRGNTDKTRAHHGGAIPMQVVYFDNVARASTRAGMDQQARLSVQVRAQVNAQVSDRRALKQRIAMKSARPAAAKAGRDKSCCTAYKAAEIGTSMGIAS